MLLGAKILNKDDGWWLEVKSPLGLNGMINLSNLNGDIIQQAFCQWANGNWSHEKEEAELSTFDNNERDVICSDDLCDYCANRPKLCNFCETGIFNKFKGSKLTPIS
ncbi:MAG: hypothetical protein KAU20_02395 [Nanoarchaeota archaeon]|nr:hypothetical protein [Nanoarchaeota archaeon]